MGSMRHLVNVECIDVDPKRKVHTGQYNSELYEFMQGEVAALPEEVAQHLVSQSYFSDPISGDRLARLKMGDVYTPIRRAVNENAPEQIVTEGCKFAEKTGCQKQYERGSDAQSRHYEAHERQAARAAKVVSTKREKE